MSGKRDNAPNDQIYEERVKKLIERMSSLQASTEDDRASRTRDFDTIYEDLERKLDKYVENKSQKVSGFTAAIRKLTIGIDEEFENRKKIELELENELASLDKSISRVLNEVSISKNDADSKLVSLLNSTIETLTTDLGRASNTRDLEGNAELEMVISQDIPRLRDELISETALRKDLEGKIVTQFSNQVEELANILAEEKKKREFKEEELVASITAASKSIEASIKKQREEREKSESDVLGLIEKVIDRLKVDIA